MKNEAHSREVASQTTGQMAQCRFLVQENIKSNLLSFFIFADFVYAQAKARNDRGFVLSNSSQPYRKKGTTPLRQSEYKSAVTVYKTDVSASAGTGPTNTTVYEERQRSCAVLPCSSRHVYHAQNVQLCLGALLSCREFSLY